MAAVAWQASVILVVAGLVGVPLGAAAGRWAWAAFATSLGAVPVTVVPVPALLAGFGVLLAAGNLLAACTGWRSPPGPRQRPCSGPNKPPRHPGPTCGPFLRAGAGTAAPGRRAPSGAQALGLGLPGLASQGPA